MPGDFFTHTANIPGKNRQVYLFFQFQPEWHTAHYSPNHLLNKNTMKDYVLRILVPHITEKRKQLKLFSDHHALVIYDMFKGQCMPAIIDLLQQNNVDIVFVPANCTDLLQPLKVCVKKQPRILCVTSSKDGMPNRFNSKYRIILSI